MAQTISVFYDVYEICKEENIMTTDLFRKRAIEQTK